jgi:hypothetical protein
MSKCQTCEYYQADMLEEPCKSCDGSESYQEAHSPADVVDILTGPPSFMRGGWF